MQMLIRQIIAVTLKELKVLWRDREAFALLFIMPVFFIVVMSFALEGVFESGRNGRPLEVLIINEDRGGLAGEVVEDLRKMERLQIIDAVANQPVTLAEAEDLISKEAYALALRFKRTFSGQIRSGIQAIKPEDAEVALIFDPTMNMQIVSSLKGTIQGVIQRRALLVRLPRLIGQGFEQAGTQGHPELGYIVENAKTDLENIFSKMGPEILEHATVQLETIPLSAFKTDRRPSATEQNVPGYTIFGVFFIVLTLATGFLQEKSDGTFQRILTAPLLKTALIVGKLLPYYLVNLIQIVLMFAIGVAFFDLRLGNTPALILVSLAVSAAANGLGLLVASVGRTEAQVNGLSVLLAITLSALGGMMVPVFVMPNFMKTLALFTPHAWALSGYHDVIIRGLGIRGVLPEVGVLFGFAGLFFLFGLWRFRFLD